MKYVKQFTIILVICLVGEVLEYLIPLPIPASVYGIIIMLICLVTGIVKVSQVKDVSKFLLEIMPLLFVPSIVGILDTWGIITDNIIPLLIIVIVSTVVVMAVAGLVTQGICKIHDKRLGKVNVEEMEDHVEDYKEDE